MLDHFSLTALDSRARHLSLVAALTLGAALISIGSASANPGSQGIQPPAPAETQQTGLSAHEGQLDVQQVLARYGQFMKHDKYGDVWKPTQVAPGWRPYEPCHWVYNQEMKSWFFDDKTEWGSIVHHYGRWALDPQQGWLWVPGSEFSPGWVAWEMRGSEVGWAPLPPEQDAAIVETAAFRNDLNQWIFVSFASLGKSCGGVAPPMPVWQPAMAPVPTQATVYESYVAGGIIGGGVIIVNACHTHPKWCAWWPGRRWDWPKPHRPDDRVPLRPHRADDRVPVHPPVGHVSVGGRPAGPDQKCGIVGHLCTGKPGSQHNASHKPTLGRSFIGARPAPSRFVAKAPRIQNRFVTHQSRVSPRVAHFQPRSFAPRMSMGPRMGGGMRFAGFPMRRR